MKQETITLKAIRENEDNPRCITDENLDKLVNSILIFPKMLELRPIVVDEHNLILGGNMRHKALTTIAGMTDEAITDRLNGMKERRGKTNGEVEALTNYWQDWAKAEYPVNIVRGDLNDDEVQQFIIKDNVSAGDWDYDALENFSQEDLEEWGVPTWGSIDDFMDYGNDSNEETGNACDERQRIIITYDRTRKEEVEKLLGKELNRPNFRLEELL